MLSRAVFLGSKQLGLSVFKAIYAHARDLKWTIIHPDDTADARTCLVDFQNLARLCDLDLLVAGSAGAAREMLSSLQPDIGFVCGWYWLLDAKTLQLVPRGLWGIHNSLLPQYRGGAPLVWSIMQGDPVVGSTVFEISEGMDDGRILHQVRVHLGPDDTIGDVLPRIEAQLVRELPEKWRDLAAGRAALQEQDETQATYCGQRIEHDGLVDWRRSAASVHNFIRAQSPPYPSAFSFLGSRTVRFIMAKVRPGTYFGTPGQVLMREGSSVLVSCGEHTALEILTVAVGSDHAPVAAGDAIRSVRARFTHTPAL